VLALITGAKRCGELSDEQQEGFAKTKGSRIQIRRKENPNSRKENQRIFLPRIEAFQWVKSRIPETTVLSTFDWRGGAFPLARRPR
jgi:hypothetical protein